MQSLRLVSRRLITLSVHLELFGPLKTPSRPRKCHQLVTPLRLCGIFDRDTSPLTFDGSAEQFGAVQPPWKGIKLRHAIKTEDLSAIALGPPTEVVDFKTKTPKLDSDGKGIYSLPVAAMSGGEQEIITVRSTQFAKGITAGAAVRFIELVISNWEFSGKSGVTFYAESVQLADATSAAVPAKPPTSVTA
jgi:hypothetical protein